MAHCSGSVPLNNAPASSLARVPGSHDHGVKRSLIPPFSWCFSARSLQMWPLSDLETGWLANWSPYVSKWPSLEILAFEKFWEASEIHKTESTHPFVLKSTFILLFLLGKKQAKALGKANKINFSPWPSQRYSILEGLRNFFLTVLWELSASKEGLVGASSFGPSYLHPSFFLSPSV